MALPKDALLEDVAQAQPKSLLDALPDGANLVSDIPAKPQDIAESLSGESISELPADMLQALREAAPAPESLPPLDATQAAASEVDVADAAQGLLDALKNSKT